ncbi:hypothetical protein H0H92_005396 [Tricholoma furcatifolium]|nr:hypothetical protein H0H92_005396 [Tricholoma furcatifolium]
MPSRSPSPRPYISNPENLILPEGPVNERTVELLDELVHPSHEEEVDLDADYDLRREHHRDLPWWKTPSPWWLIIVVPFTSIAMSATLAPRIEIFTLIVCSVLKPDIFHSSSPPFGAFDLLNMSLASGSTNGSSGLEAARGLSLHAFIDDATGGRSCAANPVVQAAVAKLSAGGSVCPSNTTIYTTSMGILGCITAGWWGAYSDRYGRTRLLSIAIIGLLYSDLNFIFTARNFERLPGGYWFVILGPLVEGSLGGTTAIVAATNAYVADTTSESARSRALSLCLGLLFTGMAIGPTIGALLVHFTGKALSVFYASFCMHLIFAAVVCFILPESLLKSQMEKSRAKHEDDLRDRKNSEAIAAGALARLKRLFSFLTPLSVFLPTSIDGGNPLKRRRDWNMSILAVVYGLTLTIIGSYPTKLQYAAATFGWTSESMGYFITIVGALRATFLAVILPCILKLFKPTPSPSSGGSESSPLLSNTSRKPTTKLPHSSAFDLGLARVSLFMEVTAYTTMALVPTTLAFVGSNMVVSLGAGFTPAVQSVALALYRRRGGTESGRLFGAMSMIQAMTSQIISPTLYALVYMKTVATFPRAIFFLSMAIITSSFTLLMFLRLPGKNTPRLPNDVEEEGTSSALP